MDSILATIKEYKISRDKLAARVKELDDMIAKAIPGAPDYAGLSRRRALLYAEIWDLQKALRLMEEYADSVSGANGDENIRRDMTA